MKKIYTIILVTLACVLSSCVQDLNTHLLNETDTTEDQAFATQADYLAALTYINSFYNFVSASDPGTPDISVKDAGQSELVRQYVNLNELSADTFTNLSPTTTGNPCQVSPAAGQFFADFDT